MRQSVRILHQCLDTTARRAGERSRRQRSVLPPKEKVLTRMEELIHHFINVTQGVNAPPGEIYFGAENPKGELGFYINSKGGRHAAPAEDPLAVVCESEHSAAFAARAT